MRDLTPYFEWFNDFIEGFLNGSKEDRKSIILKREHSLRVLDEARAITATLSLADPFRRVLPIEKNNCVGRWLADLIGRCYHRGIFSRFVMNRIFFYLLRSVAAHA